VRISHPSNPRLVSVTHPSIRSRTASMSAPSA
jgi:hypothetical protein